MTTKRNTTRLDPTGRRSVVTKRGGKINALTYAKLMQLLMQGTRSCQELARDTGLHILTVYDYTYYLHKANVIHICMWEGVGRNQTRIYMVGDKADVPRPSKSRKQISEDYRSRKAAKQLLFRIAGGIAEGETA